MVSFYKLLSVRAFPLEVSHGQVTSDPVNLHQKNVTVCSDEKGQGSQGTAFILWAPGPGWEDTDLSWSLPQGPVPRPRQPVITEGARCPTHLALRLPRVFRLPKLQGQHPQTTSQTGCCHQIAEAGMGEMVAEASRLDPASRWTWRGLWKPCRAQAWACSLGCPAHPLVQGQISQRAGEKAGIHLLPSSPPQDNTTDRW